MCLFAVSQTERHRFESIEDSLRAARRADELDLDVWLKDYTLDELWRNGRIGARA